MSPHDAVGKPSETLFPRLKRGPRAISAAEAAEHQRTRLEVAMVELAARDGYAATTLNDLVTLAGVSKSTFYELFEDKQDCFLVTFDEIIRRVSHEVGDAYRQPGDFREKLIAALSRFMDLVVEEPAAARLATVESLSLGVAGVGHRERGAAAFELMVRQSFDHSPSRVSVPDSIVRGIVAGIRGLVYRRLRSDHAEGLPGMVEELVDWALSYQRKPNAAVREAMRAASRPLVAGGETSKAPVTEIPWDEPASSERSREHLAPRERILRAAAQIVVERGYRALSIPTISTAAGISNATFYANFSSKREAFLAAFEEIADEALRLSAETVRARGDDPGAIGAGVRALLEFFAGHELFARLAFFDLPTAGPPALDRSDEVLDSFTAFLRPPLTPSAFGDPLPPDLLPAITSAVWAVIQHEIAHGRRATLPELGPEIARVAVGPFNRG